MSRRILRGTVVSDKGDKTVVVRVERRVMHPIYKKYVKRYTTLLAHDEENEAKAGDKVEIEFVLFKLLGVSVEIQTFQPFPDVFSHNVPPIDAPIIADTAGNVPIRAANIVFRTAPTSLPRRPRALHIGEIIGPRQSGRKRF